MSIVYMSGVRLSIALFFTVVCLLGVYWSLRLGYASTLAAQSDADGLREASRLAPGDAEYAAKAGVSDDDVATQTTGLLKATCLNPYYSWAWLQLGLIADSKHYGSDAELLLLKAAETDRGFDPRWALLNFYYRQNDAQSFWHWAHEAAVTGISDSSPVFRLAWRFMPNAPILLSKVAGENRAIREQLFGFVLREQSVEAAASLADAIVSDSPHLSFTLLMSYCDRLIEARQSTSAVAIWNALAETRQIVFPPVRLDSPGLVNPDFFAPITGRGLDWIAEDVPGISFRPGTRKAGGLRIQFLGSQPERCRLLRQRIPVAVAGRYRFEWRIEAGSKGAPLGLLWRVSTEDRTDAGLLAQSQEFSSDGEGALDFAAPAGQEAITLALLYLRPRGAVRLRDTIEVTKLRLRRAGE
jgi:hypothetical protein